MTTFQSILQAALDLFSVYGYEAVSVAQIADAVGIKAPSLYKHYASKQAIFDALVERNYQNYEAFLLSMGTNSDPNTPAFPVSDEQLIQTIVKLFQFFLHDPSTVKFRKMMELEQFHNEKLAKLYQKQYFDDPITCQAAIFARLTGAGLLCGSEPEEMAIAFYSPIYMLLHLCDSCPVREQEAIRKLETHIRAFQKRYKKER